MPEHLTSGSGSGSWPTPTAKNNALAPSMQKWPAHRRLMLPTPRTSDADRGGRGDLIQAVRGNENSHYRMWATPVARDARTFAGAAMMPNSEGGEPLTVQVGGTLNPQWVEWLMGWPIGWTEVEPLETDKFQRWWCSHGKR